MNNIQVYIIVEGQTEQTFVREILGPEMSHKGIFLCPILIGTPGHRGGDVRFDRAKNDIEKFLKQRVDTYVSTMFDYFRIDRNWPGKETVSQTIDDGTILSAEEKAKIMESETLTEIKKLFPDCNAENRFIPYIAMHEYEALLFSDADILAQKTGIPVDQIAGILSEYNGPEEINENPVKTPSKRLEALKPGYRKVAMGKAIADSIGIQVIRDQCPHFSDWLTRLEKLS